jgi:glycine/D-amino acid oxidase-like deaminating enzyme
MSVQRKDGRVLLGETRPEDASNTDDSSANAQRILALAAAAVPALANASIEGEASCSVSPAYSCLFNPPALCLMPVLSACRSLEVA